MILLSYISSSMQHSDSRQKAEMSVGNSCTDRSLSSSKVKKNLKSSSREARVPEQIQIYEEKVETFNWKCIREQGVVF